MESDCNVMEFYNCLHRLLTVMWNQWFTIRWITDHWQQVSTSCQSVADCHGLSSYGRWSIQCRQVMDLWDFWSWKSSV